MKFEIYKEITFRSRRIPPNEEGIIINKFFYEWNFRDNNLEMNKSKIPLEVSLKEEICNGVANVSAKVFYEINEINETEFNMKEEIEKEIAKYVDSQLKQASLDGMCFKAYGLARNSF